MDIQHNSVPAQIYLIQLDSQSNRGISNSQAIPLHLLENKNGQELLIPIVQTKQAPLNLLVDTSTKIDISKNSHQSIQAVSHLSSIPPQHTNDSILQLVDPKTLNSIPHKSNIFPKTNYLVSELNSLESKKYYNLQEVLQYPNNQSIHQTVTNRHQVFLPLNKSVGKSSTYTEKLSKEPLIDQPCNEVNTLKQKKQNYIHISDAKAPPHAIAVLPTVLQIRKNEISPRRTLPARIRFGPVQGITQTITETETKVLACNTQKPMFLLKNNNGSLVHIDVTDMDKSNWIGLLPLGDMKTANVWLYEENNKLYTITTTPINARQILKIGYSKKYAEDHQFPPGLPVMDLETVLSVNPKQWWCNECHRALSSASLLQRHVDVYHKEYIPNPRRGYRCRYCKRTFSTLFTVRRHTLQHCSKRGIKSPEKSIEKVAPTDTMNSTKYDDTKVPSDESFQNFTNGLDFSTNLFDTDRISNLDISIGSRTDVEFNSYSMTRDDNAMNNDLSKTPNKMERCQDNQITEAQNILDTCSYCDQVLLKHRKRKHASVCPARKLECECGRSFTNKKLLSEHISKEHKREMETEKKEQNKDDGRKKYKCEQCEKTFLRRGMLANHLWREHKTVTTVPVEKSVKHYPCVACPKIYRSASKRDRHVKLHHPGADKIKGLSIEGGVKSVEAALCPVCPRQYATYSKLLQHIRARHPTVAVANRKRTKRYTTANKTECYVMDGPITGTL